MVFSDKDNIRSSSILLTSAKLEGRGALESVAVLCRLRSYHDIIIIIIITDIIIAVNNIMKQMS